MERKSGGQGQQQGGPSQSGYSGSNQDQQQQRGRPWRSRGPRSQQQQGGRGRGGHSGSQGLQEQQDIPWQPRGPRRQQQRRPGQSGYLGSQGHQQHQGTQWQPRGPPQGQAYCPSPRVERGSDPQSRHQYQDQHSRGQVYQPSQRPQHQYQDPPSRSHVFERSTMEQPAPAWGKKSEPLAEQSAPAQKPIDLTAEIKHKGKHEGEGQRFQQSAATPVSPVTTAVPPAEEKAQPTQLVGKKQKRKGQEAQKSATLVTPSPTTSGVGDIEKKTEKLTLQTFDVPRRKEEVKHVGPHVMKTLIIEVNYLPLKIKDPKLKIYHYDVDFNPDVKFGSQRPKYPKYLLRNALEALRLKHFPKRYPAFDGAKNMYVAGEPLKADLIRDTVTVLNDESNTRNFDVIVKLVNDNLNIGKIFEYCERGLTSSIPQTEIQAIDIALRSALTSNLTQVGRSFFARTSDAPPLGGGMELGHGFYQSAVATWKPYLNIDVANKAFPIEQTVLQFMSKEFGCPEKEFKNGLDTRSNEKYRLDKFIKGLKICYHMPTSAKTFEKRNYRVTGLGGTPIEQRFRPKDKDGKECDGPEISVGMYYQREKNYTIQYPNLPLLMVGGGARSIMVPIELCSIIGNQVVMRKLTENQTANMVRAAACPTNARKNRIFTNFEKAYCPDNPVLKEFKMELDPSFEKVEAVVIKPPNIAYAKKDAIVRDGVWKLDNDNFINSSEIPQWAVLNLNPRSSYKIEMLESLMKSVGSKLGMRVPQPQPSQTVNHRFREKEIDDFLLRFRDKGVRLVIVVLPNMDDIYGQVKRASELRTGVLTQCIKSKTLERINHMTVSNILLKVNAKLKGVNHRIANSIPGILEDLCMLVGADVTHPGPGSENTPSIAAVAASHDKYGFQYKMLYRLQPSRQEMIQDLANIMKQQLQSFIKTNNRKPERIIYFRDGVSEGQFQQLLNVEFMAIRRACSMISPDYKPPITFLVVQKRHHTRFFPKEEDGDPKNRNVPAGTVVDQKITHPTEKDFYLVSHKSIQGTARPTKYHVLWDDMNISITDLEQLTYYLCHMFARCTRSVSYPAPTYYAHLAAFRAKAWWDRMAPNMAQLSNEQEDRGVIQPNILENYPMFFT